MYIFPSLAGTRVLVTGAAGFLGEYLGKQLRIAGCDILGLDKRAAPATAPFQRFLIGDLAKEAAHCIEGFEPEVVFHLAGSSSVPDSVRDPFNDFDIALPGTASLLAAAARASRPPRVVYFSSAAVYGDPTRLPIGERCPVRPISPYGAHKAACESLLEHYAHIYGLRVSILRIFSAYGEGLRRQFFWDFAARAFGAAARGDGQVSLLGTGEESRDFIHAEDVARAACLAAQDPGDGLQVYNVAAGEETRIGGAAEQLLALLGLDLQCRFEGVAQPGHPRRWLADTSRLRALGFELERPLSCRLPRLARWLASQREQLAS
jgi:UDP-glucose 4-epimerase